MRKKDKEIYEETDMIVLSEEEEGSKETTDVRKKKKKLPNWVIVPVIGGIVVVAVIASQFTSKEKKTGGTVEVVEVVRGDVKEIYNVSGTVDSEKKKVFYSPVNAPVNQLRAKVGQAVKAGDLLVAFDTSDLEKNNQKAQMDLQSAVNTNQSAREQADRSASEAAKAAADAQAEQLRASISVETPSASIPDTSLTQGQINNMAITENLAELAVLSSEELMAKARDGIKADFDGVISDVKTMEGGTAVAGGELFTLVSNQDVNVKLEIPASDFDKVEVGSKAVVKIGKYKYDGVVESIDKIAVPNAKGNPVIGANVKIQNPDENIYIGVAAKLTMTVAEEKDVLYLPNENVNTSTEGDFVYVVQNGVVKKKAVELGITSNSKVEIKSGLKEGDKVVADTLGTVEEGMKVTTTTVAKSEEK